MSFLQFPERIVTARLYMQPLKYEDAAEIFYTYASKPEATRFVAWQTHRSIEDTYSFLDYSMNARAAGVDYSFGIRTLSSDRLIGSIGVINSPDEIQFGYILSPTQWNQGYATEACKAILNILTQQKHRKRIFTYVAPANTASINVLHKCGLIQEALLSNFIIFPNHGSYPADCLSFVLPLPGAES